MSYSISGIKELNAGLLKREQLETVKGIVKKHTTEMQQEAMANASSTYVKGYSTGATKKSIGIGFEDNSLTGFTGLGLGYDPYVEFGTRFMAAEPLLGPVFKKHKNVFISDIKKVMQ